jgi:quercetin dioxygenase-like cupin family protein
VEHWDLTGLDVEPQRPQILDSSRGESRTIALRLRAGEGLQEHQVHERAHVVVIGGEISIGRNDGEVTGGPGLLAIFDPGERHEVRATTDALLLLVLAPWPGAGHPGARDD